MKIQKIFRDSDEVTLGILIAIYFTIYFRFYPLLAGIEDEVGYINIAHLWLKGGFSAETAGIWPPYDSVPTLGHHVPYRTPGGPIILLPLLFLGGIKAIFLMGPLIHIATTLIFALICRHFGISILWSALVLLHPTLLIFSRTVMTDGLAGLLILSSFYFYLKNKSLGFLSGFLIGFGFPARNQILLSIPAFLVDTWKQKTFSISKFLLFCIGASIFILFSVIYSLEVYGAPMIPRYEATFGAEHILKHLPIYLAGLLLLWPGLLLAPALVKNSYKEFFILLTYPYLIFFSTYYFRDTAPGKIESLILGLRFFQICLPIWILAYAIWLSTYLKKIPISKRLVQFLLVLIPVAPLYALNSKHQGHLSILKQTKVEVEDQIPEDSLIVASSHVFKLIGIPADGQKSFRTLPIHVVEKNDPLIESEKRPWYLVLHTKNYEFDKHFIGHYMDKYKFVTIPTTDQQLSIFVAEKRSENK